MITKLLCIIFIIFWIYQHTTGFSWDFIVYKLNLNYFLTGKGYFEVGRPPLPSLLLIFGDYFYIIFVSLLGYFAFKKFAEKYKLNFTSFYFAIHTPFVILTAFSIGTEYLSLVLLTLFIVYIKKPISGFLAGLLTLTHYSNLVFLPLLIFSKKQAIPLFILTIMPWLLFNYSIYQNPFYSFIDQYTKNIQMRQWHPLNSIHPLIITPYFPLAIISIFLNFNFLMFLVFILRIIAYVKIPFKIIRYLYPIVLPVSYFSVKLLKRPVFYLSFLLFPFFFFPLEDPQPYIDAVSKINSSCMVLSNAWPFINYLGVNAGPEPRLSVQDYYLNKGYIILHFKFINEPNYDSSGRPVIFENSQYFILSTNKCYPSYYYNKSYLEELDELLNLIR